MYYDIMQTYANHFSSIGINVMLEIKQKFIMLSKSIDNDDDDDDDDVMYHDALP